MNDYVFTDGDAAGEGPCHYEVMAPGTSAAEAAARVVAFLAKERRPKCAAYAEGGRLYVEVGLGSGRVTFVLRPGRLENADVVRSYPRAAD